MKMAVNEIIQSFMAKVEKEINPRATRQDLEQVVFEGLITEKVISEINLEMTKAKIPYRFGNFVELNSDFSGFAARNGRVYIHATNFGNYKKDPMITWGFVELRC